MTNKDVWDVEKEKSSFILFYLFVCLSFNQIFIIESITFILVVFNVFIMPVVLFSISVCFGRLQFFSQMCDFIGVGRA